MCGWNQDFDQTDQPFGRPYFARLGLHFPTLADA